MTIDEQVAEEVKKVTDRMALMDERVSKLDSVHEDLIIIERLDHGKWRSVIIQDPAADRTKVRTSWYGRVISISQTQDTINELKEYKKSLVKIGHVVLYNPDAAFSLNLDGFPEVWCLSIENILVKDHGLDYLGLIEKSCRDRAETIKIQEEARKAQEEARLAFEAAQPKDSGIVHGPLSPIVRISGSDKDILHKYYERREQMLDGKKR